MHISWKEGMVKLIPKKKLCESFLDMMYLLPVHATAILKGLTKSKGVVREMVQYVHTIIGYTYTITFRYTYIVSDYELTCVRL